MKRIMNIITAFLSMAFAIFLTVFVATNNSVIEIVTISVGVTLYHFAMRLAVGTTVNFIMKNQADHENAWFRERRFEKNLYAMLGVRKWKKYLPTYSSDAFDTSKKTLKEIVGATCQAEIVHEIIMVLSLLPIALIPLLGGAWAMIITSVLSMAFDSLFVMLQRYNRPRLLRVMTKFHRLKNCEHSISNGD